MTIPYAADLGANVPLSFSAPGAIAASSSLAKCEMSGSRDKVIVNIDHTDSEQLPYAIDALESIDGKTVSLVADGSRSFPKLDATLKYSLTDNSLILSLTNNSDSAMTGIECRLGMPLAFPADDNRYQLGDISPGKTSTCIFKMPPLVKEDKLLTGKQFFFVLTDFKLNQKAARIYAATQSELTPLQKN